MLFEKLKIKDIELKNRIVMAPMCMYSAEGGYVNDFHIIHYATRAMGQIGLVIIEATAVLENGQITKNDLGIWDDLHVKGLNWIVKRVKYFDAKVGIQLAHAGRKAKDTNNMIAPSAVAFSDHKLPREMTIKEIKDVINAFRLGAKRAFEAGFDFIEIHAAHGYLINQFLSPLANKRTDEYGGTREKRTKFLIEILEEVRKEWPAEKPLGIRVSATEYDSGGINGDEIVKIINLIPQGLIDIINVSTGGLVYSIPPTYPGYQMPYAKKIKKETNYFVMGGGLIKDGVFANDLIKAGESDLLYFGRLALREPYFPLRFAIQLKYDLPYLKQYERAKDI